MALLSGVALVIGACSSYGRAVAGLLVENGCSRLILGDANEAELAKVQAECEALGGSRLQIRSKKCYIKATSELEEIIEFGVREFGVINYCANCERFDGLQGRTAEISLDDFIRAGDAWQKGVWLAMREQVRYFLRQQDKNDSTARSIVNITAAQGFASDGGFPSFCAAAHGIVGMSRATAMDYLKKGIRINCVCPGPTKPSEDHDHSQSHSLSRVPPTGRYITAEEVAHAVVFLLGEGASSITGIELPVDGGWSLYHY